MSCSAWLCIPFYGDADGKGESLSEKTFRVILLQKCEPRRLRLTKSRYYFARYEWMHVNSNPTSNGMEQRWWFEWQYSCTRSEQMNSNSFQYSNEGVRNEKLWAVNIIIHLALLKLDVHWTRYKRRYAYHQIRLGWQRQRDAKSISMNLNLRYDSFSCKICNWKHKLVYSFQMHIAFELFQSEHTHEILHNQSSCRCIWPWISWNESEKYGLEVICIACFEVISCCLSLA